MENETPNQFVARAVRDLRKQNQPRPTWVWVGGVHGDVEREAN